MGIGPITVFDKSTLQSLSMDESVWLDTFFLVNVVPLFYVETLADLEKDVARGKTTEDLVGMLAAKTPTSAVPNLHHRSLISAELTGETIPMDGRVPLGGGDIRRRSDGSIGIHVEEFDEAAALDRWKNHEFLEIEHEIATHWRSELVDDDRDRTIGVLRNILPTNAQIRDLPTLKAAIDTFCEGQELEVIALALNTLGVPDRSASEVLARWEALGRPQLAAFAPYTTHVFKVDLLYYLGIERGFISGERPSNKVDMAYLYYLPFSMVFTSGDNLHRRTAPLFLRSDQSFVEASALKAALKKLDNYYDAYPDEVKALGVMAFAHYPPTELDNLVVDLWDKHMAPNWRDGAETPEQVLARRKAARQGERKRDELLSSIENAQPLADPRARLQDHDTDYVVIGRRVPVQKGKWRLVPEGIEAADEEGSA
jgi:hypothetical protein